MSDEHSASKAEVQDERRVLRTAPVGEPTARTQVSEEPRAGGRFRRLTLVACVSSMVIAADQATKSWAVDRLVHGPVHVVWKLDLQLAFNSGSAFSLAQGWAPVLGGLAIVAVVVLLAFVRHVRSTSMLVAVGLIVGGALGNLSDRVFRSHHGSVVDFIAFHFWPTFNVADSAVVIGALWAAVLIWSSDRTPVT